MKVVRSGWLRMALSLFLCLPLAWSATGQFWIPKGVQYMPFLVVLALFSSLALFGRDQITANAKNNHFAQIIFSMCLYAIFSYYYHGYGSREMRAFIVSFVYLIIFQRPSFISTEKVYLISVPAALGIFAIAVVQAFFLSVDRIHGYINPIVFATYCASVSILLFCLGIAANNYKRAVLVGLFILTLLATILTGSRGVWIALFAAILVLSWSNFHHRWKYHRRKLLTMMIVLVVGLGLLLGFGKQRITHMFEEIDRTQAGEWENAIGIRLQYLLAGAELAKDAPVFGLGDQYRDKLQRMYEQGEVSAVVLHYSHFHNQYLDTFVRKGFVGFILLAAFLLFPLRAAMKLPETSWRRNTTIGLFVLLLISGLTDVPLNHGEIIYVYVFFLTALNIPYDSSPDHKE